MSKKWNWVPGALLVLLLVLSACGAEEPEVVGGFEIPAIEDGKFNVAMVLIGPHDDLSLIHISEPTRLQV